MALTQTNSNRGQIGIVSKSDVDVVLCGDGESGLWDSFLEKCRTATISHIYRWRRIISDSYSHQSFYLIALRGREPVGILPLIWVRSWLFGNCLASMPFQDYGGVIAADAQAARALLERALQLRDDCRADCLELRHRDVTFQGEGILRQDKVTLILDTSSGADQIWKSLSPKVRNQVRKAEKSGLTTQLGGGELLDEFYQVFAANMHDLGSPVHSFDFLKQVFAHFGDCARLMVIRDGQRTVGGLIGLFQNDTVIVPWASSLREYFPKCPNNLLYWHMIQYACERRCKSFDFGRSTIGSGTYKFKLQWGAAPVQLNWQLYARNGAQIVRPDADAKYRLSANLWKHMPLALTTYLGPCLRKYLTN
jgi:serine/alanine adding enzyme